MKLAGMLILLAFYSVYFGKMLLQKKKGIKTDQIAKGKVKDRVYYTELVMKFATYLVVIIEIISIFCADQVLPAGVRVFGLLLCIFGDVVFASAVVTMKDSWRAGLAQHDKTDMITGGIYQISRNPAFLGFDCVYVGLLLMFFNWLLLVFSVFAILMLHLQILQEEAYLPTVFGEQYLAYKRRVCRYLGRKHG